MRRAAVSLVVVGGAFALAHFGITVANPDEVWARVVPDVVAAVLAAVLFFAPGERPLVHEAHELPVSVRALIQALAVSVVFALVWAEESLRTTGKGTDALTGVICALGFTPALFLVAFVETRARRYPARLRRDLGLFVLAFGVGAVALHVMWFGQIYVVTLLSSGSPQRAIAAVADAAGQLKRSDSWIAVSGGLVFAFAAVARAREATPKVVLAAAFLGAFAVGFASVVALRPDAYIPRAIRETLLLDLACSWVPLGISLALGGGLGDKSTRKIEARLPSSHSHSH